jgi:hypothetical protein
MWLWDFESGIARAVIGHELNVYQYDFTTKKDDGEPSSFDLKSNWQKI